MHIILEQHCQKKDTSHTTQAENNTIRIPLIFYSHYSILKQLIDNKDMGQDFKITIFYEYVVG